MTTLPRATGVPLDRVEGREKVTGAAKYAYEVEAEGVVYGVCVGATIAKGAVVSVDAAPVRGLDGVLDVLWHGNAVRLEDTGDGELAVFQSDRVAYRGQVVAAVVAESLEAAREGARLLQVEYSPEPHDVELRADHPKLYKPPNVVPNYETDTSQGDFDSAFASAEVSVDLAYSTPAYHHNAMETHSTLAVWDGEGLTLYDSTQSHVVVRDSVAQAFGLSPDRVRVVSPHVGGGFGSKLRARPNVIVAAMAARMLGRPVKVAATRQQMFAFAGYRTPIIQRLRLGAAHDGTLTAICHDVFEQSSTLVEFAEQTAVGTRWMYAAPHRRTTHRLARLDVPTPTFMRAPGECPGMFALESAMDELAAAAGLDPVELRIRNEPEVEPESGKQWSTRGLVACLREGAERFGWAERDPEPAVRREGRWLVGTGVASSTYPARRRPAQARASVRPAAGATESDAADADYLVQIAAADIGTGARTVLTQIAADALEVELARVRVEVGDTAFPPGPGAGGSMGTTSWGSAVWKACRELRSLLAEQHGGVLSSEGLEVVADTSEDVERDEPLARYAFGAQFAEARVDMDTGEVRVPRLLGVFAGGRVINPKTARSQLVGGMVMGISMALHEESVLDPRFGDYVNHDFAGYHVAANADIRGVEAYWIDEDDTTMNPMGAKGLGEIGIVGTAAALANAVYHATGVRVRDLPIGLSKLVGTVSPAPL
jgi:xanthine dehydrogenase YagR molybdenum-binding subunit